jgi:type IV secretory pathway VirB2 component (pilin)
MRHQTITQTRFLRDLGMLCLLAFVFVALSSSATFATPVSVGDILCKIYGVIQNDVGRGIATLAVVSLGISALVGKVSWGMAIMVGVGVAVMFGAPSILSDAGVSHC